MNVFMPIPLDLYVQRYDHADQVCEMIVDAIYEQRD